MIRSRKKEKNLENRCQEERILRDKSWVSTNIVSDYPLENEIILWFVVLDSFFFCCKDKYFVIDSCMNLYSLRI